MNFKRVPTICLCGMRLFQRPSSAHLRGVGHTRSTEVIGLLNDKSLTGEEIARRLGITPSAVRLLAKGFCVERHLRSEVRGKDMESLEEAPERLRFAVHAAALAGVCDFAFARTGGTRPMTTRLYLNGRRCCAIVGTCRKTWIGKSTMIFLFRKPIPTDYEFLLVQCGPKMFVIPEGEVLTRVGCITSGTKKRKPGSLSAYEERWDLIATEKQEKEGESNDIQSAS